MGIGAPEVTVENIIKTGFADIITNANTYLPLALATFPTEYQNLAISYIQSPNFKINTAFGYAYDASTLPMFNIVLSSESEGTASSKQRYLGDIVDAADDNPNTEDLEAFGSLWSCAITVIVRAQEARQAIILYALTKWLMLKNRIVLEAAGVQATTFSGTDLLYDSTKQPLFAFSRAFKMDCLVMNTYDVDITADPTLTTVISAFPDQVRILPQSQVTQD
jgi:hypothetical protein